MLPRAPDTLRIGHDQLQETSLAEAPGSWGQVFLVDRDGGR
jgi:hypothetical protein